MYKIYSIFSKDVHILSRDFIAIYIILTPLIFALIINAITPAINDTTVNLGLLKTTDAASIEYLSQFATVEIFDNQALLENRIKARDDFFGLIRHGKNYIVLAEGDEPKRSEEYARLLATFDVSGVTLKDSSVTFNSFNIKMPSIKRILVNGCLMFIAVLGGMLILIGIVEEKSNHTISAINLTPVSKRIFIMGKSIIGLCFPILGSILLLYITGFKQINYLQLLLVIIGLCALSGVIGILIGLNSEDIISAGGNMKILFLPMMLSIAGAELFSPFWQRFLYWSPFYWAYKANNIVLTNHNDWQKLLLYTSIIIIISLTVTTLLIPKIRKSLT